ncbi:helix-turn-helix domain-containing protein [Hamadaea tsunoensis]|uniref:helix-turn-helix domain-containing protein n=1 Tax=Hamadaea tsunoensis TaxID=53368 RepID=UPI001B7FCB15|nr:helix-turn-helix domain-containing protein [Hamadaea tsunoensis]
MRKGNSADVVLSRPRPHRELDRARYASQRRPDRSPRGRPGARTDVPERPLSTSETASSCGLALSTASHHLGVLREAGLIHSRRDGGAVRHTQTVLGEALTQRR